MSLPIFGFEPQLALSGGSQLVEFCLAVILAFTPLRLDEALVLQPVQGRIERALFNLEVSLGQLLNPEQHAIAVLWAERHCFQNQHVQRAAQEIDIFAHLRSLLGTLGESYAVSPELSSGIEGHSAVEQKTARPIALPYAQRIARPWPNCALAYWGPGRPEPDSRPRQLGPMSFQTMKRCRMKRKSSRASQHQPLVSNPPCDMLAI